MQSYFTSLAEQYVPIFFRIILPLDLYIRNFVRLDFIRSHSNHRYFMESRAISDHVQKHR